MYVAHTSQAAAQHSVHPIPDKHRGHGGGTAASQRAHALRAVRQFVWLEVDSDKVTLSHPTHQRVTPAVRALILAKGICMEKKTIQEDLLYPERIWSQYAFPEEAGFSSSQMMQAQNYFNQMGSASLLVVHDGAILAAWGDVTRRFVSHSIRKSYMSALYGIHVDNENINLNETLAELNTDDEPALTPMEKEARVFDLITARSGVYHPAAAETPYMTENKPERCSHKPGAYWCYNNWDFNALHTIFELKTQTSFFEEFRQKLATPLQMEEFRLSDTFYYFEKDKSIHPAYHFRLSAKDMARFGLLYLRKGKWKDQQIIPEKWIAESTATYSSAIEEKGYGYLWWTIGPRYPNQRLYELGTYMAEGVGPQFIIVLPGANLVVVHLTNTYLPTNSDETQFWTLLNMILDARISSPVSKPNLIPFQSPSKRPEIIQLENTILDKYVGEYEFEGGFRGSIRRQDNKLVWTSISASGFPAYLLPISKTKFFVEDLEDIATFALDNEDYQLMSENPQREVARARLVRRES
jgi:CubicO group peptidase (beta-lactamase class C family)